jgi:hypothetical protein
MRTKGSPTPSSTCGREVTVGRQQMRGGGEGLSNGGSALGGGGGPAEEGTPAAVRRRMREGPGESLPGSTLGSILRLL